MSRVSFALGAASSAILLLAGCASEPRPAEQLARAKTLVEQADAANVQRYAAAELNDARDKLQVAQKADAAEEYSVARMRADEAAVVAELASARARSREAGHAADEMKKGLETLRQEIGQGLPVSQPEQ
jgi:hypothetical protein